MVVEIRRHTVLHKRQTTFPLEFSRCLLEELDRVRHDVARRVLHGPGGPYRLVQKPDIVWFSQFEVK